MVYAFLSACVILFIIAPLLLATTVYLFEQGGALPALAFILFLGWMLL